VAPLFVDTPTFFTHYPAFAGIGTFALLFKLLGGQCVGGCEIDEPTAHGSDLHQGMSVSRRRPRPAGAGHRLAARCDIFDSGAPCQTFSIAGRKAGMVGRGALMFEQLEYLRHHQLHGALFEQVPNFLLLQKGELFRQFAAALIDCGYRVHHRVLKARHHDSHQLLYAMALRSCSGHLSFPAPTPPRDQLARSVLVPLPIFEGERFSSKLFRAPPPVLHLRPHQGREHSSSHARMHCVERRGSTADSAMFR
jgi:hypothetical protein